MTATRCTRPEDVAPERLSQRLHNGALQFLGAALLDLELCEHLQHLGRANEVAVRLADARSLLEQSCTELRELMTDLEAVAPL